MIGWGNGDLDGSAGYNDVEAIEVGPDGSSYVGGRYSADLAHNQLVIGGHALSSDTKSYDPLLIYK